MGKLLTFIILHFLSQMALAWPWQSQTTSQPKFSCPIRVVDGSQLNFRGDYLVINTHPSTLYDHNSQSLNGLITTLKAARDLQIPKVVLLDPSGDPESHFLPQCATSHYVYSNGGEFNFNFEARHVISAGGFTRLCQRQTISNVLKNWASRRVRQDYSLTIVADASYDGMTFFDEFMLRMPDLKNANASTFGPSTIAYNSPAYSTIKSFVQLNGDWVFSLERTFRLYETVVGKGSSFAWLKAYFLDEVKMPTAIATPEKLEFPRSHSVVLHYFYRPRQSSANMAVSVGLEAEGIDRREVLIDRGPNAPIINITVLHSADLMGSAYWRLAK